MIQQRRADLAVDDGFAVVEAVVGGALLAAAGVGWRVVSGLPDEVRGLVMVLVLVVLVALATSGGVASAVVSDRRDRHRTFGPDPHR